MYPVKYKCEENACTTLYTAQSKVCTLHIFM